jgi:hypothetical protein
MLQVAAGSLGHPFLSSDLLEQRVPNPVTS